MNPGRRLDAVLTLGIPVHPVSMAQALERIESFIEARRPRYVVTPNLDFAARASRDVELHRILCEADLALCDGMPLVWASRWFGGRAVERVAGSDLLHPLLERAAEKGYRIFFLGTSPDVLEEARTRCEARYPGIRVCGVHSPPYAQLLALDHEALKTRIRQARPDILLVGLGMPKQEKFIYMNYRELEVPCSIGVGASLDFLAGRFVRAPRWMKRTGTEWVFRMLQEPRRLVPRYWADLRFYIPAMAMQLILVGKRSRARDPAQLARVHEAWHVWRGRIDAAAPIEAGVEPTARRGKAGGLVIDLEGVTSIDAAGLGLILGAWKARQEEGRNLVLHRPSATVRRALRASRLDRIFWTASTPQEADRLLALDPDVPSVRARYDGARATLRLTLAGELTARGAGRCRLALRGCYRAHPEARVVELDLEELSFADSAGLALMLEGKRAVQERPGGRFVVLRPSPNVANVIGHGAPGLLRRARPAVDSAL